MGMESIGTPWLWAGFAAVVLAMLAIDLFVVGGGREHRVSTREAATWSAVWVAVSLAFAGALWWHLDASAGREVANARTGEFLTGYLIEKSLAVDNVFVWLMLFSSFAIPVSLQRRVLVYGVVGAIVMRTAMIFAGAWLIAQFHWILYLFGAFLVVTGVKMWWFAGAAPDIERNPLVRWLRAHVPITHALHGERFFVRVPVAGAGTGAAVAAPAGAGMPAAASRAAAGTRGTAGRLLLHATPLFLVLVLVEVTDLIFAVDSIPAVFAITTDPFIVLTSNVFAILGLRAMYFLLADMADRFTLLKYGLAIVLVLIGTKMLLIDLVHIPVWLSLGCVATIIATSVMLSLSRNRGAGRAVEAVVPARR